MSYIDYAANRASRHFKKSVEARDLNRLYKAESGVNFPEDNDSSIVEVITLRRNPLNRTAVFLLDGLLLTTEEEVLNVLHYRMKTLHQKQLSTSWRVLADFDEDIAPYIPKARTLPVYQLVEAVWAEVMAPLLRDVKSYVESRERHLMEDAVYN